MIGIRDSKAPGGVSTRLLQNAVTEMGDAVGLHYPRAFQGVLAVIIGEQPATATEQDRNQVQVNLVQ
jgi:hypothetical protein